MNQLDKIEIISGILFNLDTDGSHDERRQRAISCAYAWVCGKFQEYLEENQG